MSLYKKKNVSKREIIKDREKHGGRKEEEDGSWKNKPYLSVASFRHSASRCLSQHWRPPCFDLSRRFLLAMNSFSFCLIYPFFSHYTAHTFSLTSIDSPSLFLSPTDHSYTPKYVLSHTIDTVSTHSCLPQQGSFSQTVSWFHFKWMLTGVWKKKMSAVTTTHSEGS